MISKSPKEKVYIRRLDSVGRVVLPSKLRESLGIDINDSIHLYRDRDSLVVRKGPDKYTCCVTGKVDKKNLHLHDGTYISLEGLAGLAEEHLVVE